MWLATDGKLFDFGDKFSTLYEPKVSWSHLPFDTRLVGGGRSGVWDLRIDKAVNGRIL